MQDDTDKYRTDEEEFARLYSPGTKSSAQDIGSEVVDVSKGDRNPASRLSDDAQGSETAGSRKRFFQRTAFAICRTGKEDQSGAWK